MPYHVKAAVNHMHYCSSAYINHYEIFLGEKRSRACREPLCPLLKWNKLVILRAWQIICNKSLGDFLLLMNGDCIFQSHHATKELNSGSCTRAEGALGEPPKPAWCHCASAAWILVVSWLWDTRPRFFMALHPVVSTHQLTWGWHRSPWHCCFAQEYGPAAGLGFIWPFPFCLFERERDSDP